MYPLQNNYEDSSLFISGQKKIERLLKKDDFKVVTSDKVVTSEEISSSTQGFNSHFLDNIKDSYTPRAYDRCYSVMHTSNDKKKNIMLGHSPKIPMFTQVLRDIEQTCIKIASDLNPDFDIRPLSDHISQLSASFDPIVKVMRQLYGEPEAGKYRFAILHPHYKKKSGLQNPHMVISLKRWVKQ